MVDDHAELTYVIDTNVFLDCPDVLDVLSGKIVIPLPVIEELDDIRSRGNHLSPAARQATRSIDEALRNEHIREKIVIDTAPPGFLSVDDFVLSSARHYEGSVLLTNDLALRIKASGQEVMALPYPFDGGTEDNDEGEMLLPSWVISDIYNSGRLAYEKGDLYPHQYTILRDVGGSSQSALAKYDPNGYLVLVKPKSPWQVHHKNTEQLFAIDALMDESIPVVILTGLAGTGKTILSLAAAFEKVIEKRVYEKLVIAKPTIPVGRDIGYFPGTKDEKLQVWLQNYQDNADELLGNRDTLFMYIQKGVVEMESLAHIRGRSLKNSFIIIDEVQNCSQHEIKTFLTRVGEGSKIVLLGDLTQIDNERITKTTSGLSFLVERSRDSDLVAHVHLTDSSVRSSVAAWAAANL